LPDADGFKNGDGGEVKNQVLSLFGYNSLLGEAQIMQPFSPKEPSPNFNNPAYQQEFLKDTQNLTAVLQKELDLNRAEQTLLQQRIQLLRDFINDLPSSDPQYAIMSMQMRLDEIELDELKIRATELSAALRPR
jgi:hypothetical protein